MHAKWFVDLTRRPDTSLDVFCFPFAGGSPASFSPWLGALAPSVGLIGVQLPGRGLRFGEPMATVLDDVVGVLAQALIQRVDKPFMFFGHSNGALISFELARRLVGLGAPSPRRLVLSAARAPHLLKGAVQRHRYDDVEMIMELHRLGGTPAEVFDSREMLAMILPVLRADFALTETHPFPEPTPVPVPATLLYGRRDPVVKPADVLAWQAWLEGRPEILEIDGDHFYLSDARRLICDLFAAEVVGVPQPAAAVGAG